MVTAQEGDVQPSRPLGLSEVLNYICRDQVKNIVNQLQQKANGIINDAISAHIRNKPEGTVNNAARLKKELKKRIMKPTSRRATNVQLDDSDQALIRRVRNGFFPLTPAQPSSRQRLFTAQERNTKWLDDDYFDMKSFPRKKKMLPIIITHFIRLLIHQEQMGAKGRAPLPLFSKRLMHIKIDARTLYYVIKNAKDMDSANGRLAKEPDEPVFLTAAKHFEKNKRLIKAWIHHVFQVAQWKDDRTGRGKYRISDDKGVFVTSNGFDVSFLLRERDFVGDAALLASNQALHLSPHDDDVAPTSTETDETEVDSRPKFIVNIDPGRRNILYIIITDSQGRFLKKIVLTRAGFYEKAKMNAVRKRTNKRNATGDLKDILEEFSEHHFITANVHRQVQAFKTYCENHLTYWTEKGRKFWYRQRFHIYQNKTRVIDLLLNQIGEDITVDGITYVFGEVRYENGEFPSGRRYERSVP